MQEFFNISLIITQHLNRGLGERPGVTLSKVSKYKRSLSAEDNNHVLLCDLGGSLGIDQKSSAPRNPAITAMNYMNYEFGVFNHQDVSNISKLRRALSFSDFPWMNCNVGHPRTKEPFFGEPYRVFIVNGMKLIILGSYGGRFIPEAEKKDPILHISRLNTSVKKWLRYIYDLEDPDYVIVCVSDWSEPLEDIVKDMEGVGMLITGSHTLEEDRFDADAGWSNSSNGVLSPSETYPVPESRQVPMHHHHHANQAMHISMNFKTRTNTYEYMGHSVTKIDSELAQLSEDNHLLDLVHYHL
ncbi:hypothetical protein [Salinicoccus albus]|uniref:hypothetical protein n=1 Tax=Salinicoccus albus TaxID=418756 RepID=UPI000362477A|nr:hypothetical protein [Salinicoccus albus]